MRRRNALRPGRGIASDWAADLTRCSLMVEVIRCESRRAGKVWVRCTNAATRRLPGGGYPVCRGGCVHPEQAAGMLGISATWLAICEANARRIAARTLPPYTVDHDPGDAT